MDRILQIVAGACLLALHPGCKPASSPTPAPATGGSSASESASGFRVDDPALVRRNNEGVGMMGRFDFDAALAIFDELAEAHPAWHDVRVNAAIATFNRQKTGDEVEGLRRLDAVLAEDDTHLRASYCAGLLTMRDGRVDVAKAHFQRVLDARPDDAYALYFVAQCVEQIAGEGFRDEAMALYRRAAELDPYLRSPHYRLYQLLLRAGDEAAANVHFEIYQRLEDNPRGRLIELVYTKMGPMGEARAVDLERADAGTPPAAPAGPLFGRPVSIASERAWRGGGETSITAADIDGDGDIDVLVAGGLDPASGAPNAVLLGDGAGGLVLAEDHPLADISGVNAAAWGDWNDDGRTDVYLCRRGPNQLWSRTADGAWTDDTVATGTGGGDLDTVDGAFLDADHDGDLDLFCVNRDGANELFNNDRDGAFRPIAASSGLTGGGSGRRVLAVDLDGHRDLDLVVLNDSPPHEVYLNRRLWAYEPAGAEYEAFVAADLRAVVAADTDADGRVELHGLDAEGRHVVFPAAGAEAPWTAEAPDGFVSGAAELAVLDVTGDGALDLLRATTRGVRVDRAAGPPIEVAGGATGGIVAWAPIVLDARGPSVFALRGDGGAQLFPPGTGRFPFVAITLSGQTDPGQSMRSNASGLGSLMVARTDSRWTIERIPGAFSGAGGSLQPVAIGTGGAGALDFVTIDWTDGIFQSEVALAAGEIHHVTETQRQSSSCPVLFTWNGSRYEFVSDVLGTGGIGFLLAPGEYAEPRPWERFLLPEGALVPQDGVMSVKINEPMQEAAYLDSVALEAWDLPPGWSMVLDERMGLAAPFPTGDARFYRAEQRPVAARNDRGDDVLEAVLHADDRAAPLPPLDHRFIGRLASEHVLELAFARPLDDGSGRPVLMIDGWVEYPYAQTMFAAWQADAAYQPPSLDVRGADGVWREHLVAFGYPAGMPRRMSVPLDDLPAGTTSLRLRTNQEIYWDRVAVIHAEACPDAVRRTLELTRARVAHAGFPKRTDGPQRRPRFDYDDRAPFWDTRHAPGAYTRFGTVTPLVERTDDALAIIGPGEEIEVSFTAPIDAVPSGWTRRYVLDFRGWCKDMDLYTRDGDTLGPLPATGRPPGPRDALHETYNTRDRSGMAESLR